MTPGLAIPRRTLVILAAGVLLLAGAVALLAAQHASARDRLAQLEPRYARLVGIEGSANALELALGQRRALLSRHAYPAELDVARAGSDAQQRARDIFSKAGLDVSSTQVLPAKALDGFDRIPVVIRVDGELSALQGALVVLPAQAPSLFVDGLNIQTAGMPRPDGSVKLAVQVNLFVLRARP
jgi:general secretion pathway protein M